MNRNYKLELSSASLRTWNDGMLEKWNDGMASFGQINACGGIKLSIVNCQLLIVNEISTHGLLQNLNYKQITKGSHGLHQDSLGLQSMTALIKSFCGGLIAKRKAQGAKRIIRLALYAKRYAPCAFPLAAGGKDNG